MAHQMIVTLEWDEDLGPRWLNKDNLMSMLGLDGDETESPKVKHVAFLDSTPKERAVTEFEQLSQRMDKLGELSYKKFMELDEHARTLLADQYTAMTYYRQAILARINAWTDETS